MGVFNCIFSIFYKDAIFFNFIGERLVFGLRETKAIEVDRKALGVPILGSLFFNFSQSSSIFWRKIDLSFFLSWKILT